MDNDYREAARAADFRLPMTVTKHSASVGRIDFDRLGRFNEIKRGPREEIADDSLQVPAGKAATRFKRSQPIRLAGDAIGRGFKFKSFRDHRDSAFEKIGDGR